ncbi:MAG: hypothetical protein ABIN05_07815 [candidate division WOR-3 bacterium]
MRLVTRRLIRYAKLFILNENKKDDIFLDTPADRTNYRILLEENRELFYKACLTSNTPSKKEIENALIEEMNSTFKNHSCYTCKTFYTDCFEKYLSDKKEEDEIESLKMFPVYTDEADIFCQEYVFDTDSFNEKYKQHIDLINWFEKNYLIDGSKMIKALEKKVKKIYNIDYKEKKILNKMVKLKIINEIRN